MRIFMRSLAATVLLATLTANVAAFGAAAENTLTTSTSRTTTDTMQGVFGANQRLLSAYYFHLGPWNWEPCAKAPWKVTYPPPTDPMAAAFGLNDPARWPENRIPDTSKWPMLCSNSHKPSLDLANYKEWIMADWRAMKWSGLDFVFVDIWTSLCFVEGGAAKPEYQALLDAWTELDRRGENPVPMTFLLETPFAWLPPKMDGDCTQASKDGIDEIWLPARYYLRQFYGEGDYAPRISLKALARVRVGDEARPILLYWFPYWVGTGIKRWNAWTFDELRRKCRETFGVTPYIGVHQHVYSLEGGWNGPQPEGGPQVDISPKAGVVDFDASWWGAWQGPQIYDKSIVIGPGHWAMFQTTAPIAQRYSPEYGKDVSRYEMNWRKVLSDPASFRRQFLIIEAWNNEAEACTIAYSEARDVTTSSGEVLDRWGPTPEFYMEMTKKYAPYWKAGRVPPGWGTDKPTPTPASPEGD